MKRIYTLSLLLVAALYCSMSSASATDAPENPYSEGHTVRQLDTVKTFVALPRGMSYTYGNGNIRSAFEDLIAPSRNPECELVRFIVAGCASPDGLWAYNVTLSEDRTNNTVQYLKALGMMFPFP